MEWHSHKYNEKCRIVAKYATICWLVCYNPIIYFILWAQTGFLSKLRCKEVVRLINGETRYRNTQFSCQQYWLDVIDLQFIRLGYWPKQNTKQFGDITITSLNIIVLQTMKHFLLKDVIQWKSPKGSKLKNKVGGALIPHKVLRIKCDPKVIQKKF